MQASVSVRAVVMYQLFINSQEIDSKVMKMIKTRFHNAHMFKLNSKAKGITCVSVI